jgi:nitrate reductase (cytochrome)
VESKSTILPEKHEAVGLSRRELMKVVGTSAGLACLLPIAGCENLWERQPVIDVDSWHKGVCRFCGTGCGVMIGLKENKAVDVKGDSEAHNRGRLCIKGLATRDILYTEGRALHPMIRKNGELQRTSWDEAMSLVAQRFKEAIETQGPDSVAFYGSGQLYTQETYTANKLFKAGIGTNNVDGNPRLCMASAVTGYTSTFGKDEPAGCYEDIDHAECFFVTGSNTLECHPIIWERVQDRKRSYSGTKIILVDPRKTFTAQHADLHLQIIPGTDVALYNAIIHVFLEQNFIDRDMIEHYLSFQESETPRSFTDFTRHIARYSPETVARTCGISSMVIREAAFLFASSKATMSLWTMGLNQQVQGTASNRLVCAMHLLTGHFGRPGATPFSLTGQPNACGGVRDTGSLSHALPNGRLVTNPKHRMEMEDLWRVPRGRISPTPGHHTVSLFDAMNRGAVRCCLVMCTNPGHTLPDITAYQEGMNKAFLVVVDAFHPTETTKFADVVLPAALWVEKEGVKGNAERRYHLCPKLVDPPGEARSDLDILIDLAHRLGHGGLISAKTPKDVWDEWRKISAHSQYNFEGITYERLQTERGLLWPCPTDTHPGTKRRYIPGEDPMATGSGRFDFYGKSDGRATVWLDHQEKPLDPYTDEFPLIFNTGRILEHWHTMTITGPAPTLKAIHPDYLEMHPYDANPLKITEGDLVVVRSRRGKVELRARLTDSVRPGMVFATMHSALHLVNHVTHDAHDPHSKQPAYKRCAVSVRRKTT